MAATQQKARRGLVVSPVLTAVATLLAVSWMVHATPATSSAADRPLRIMPIGDSITEARANTPGKASYRQPLWNQLAANGYEGLDFVGSRHGVYRDPNPPGAWDKDHDGHWGWRADEILNGRTADPGADRLSDWASTYVPDVALIHIGTNDALQGQSAGSTVTEIRQMIGLLRASNPDVRVVIAKVIPTTKSSAAAQAVVALNAGIGPLANQSTTRSPVVIADMHNGYNPAWNYDTVHPGPEGLTWMAERWAAALIQHNLLSPPAGSDPPPTTPLPTASSPTTLPTGTAAPSPSLTAPTGTAPSATPTGTAKTTGPAASPTPWSCLGRPATLVGTRGADQLVGTRGADVIVARGGADSIRARGGADIICAGGGNDTVAAGRGDDIVRGHGGADLIRGGRGADVIRGGSGADQLRGGRGADTIRGGLGQDTCFSPQTAPGCS